jgi:HlyD family secretion protein
MNCNASIYIVEKNNVLLIPVEAVTNIGGRSMVFVKSGGQSQYINMQEGFIPGETIENIEGSSSDRMNRKGMRGGVPQGTQENSENSEESTEESNESSVMSEESPTLSVWNNDDTAKTTNENTPPDFNQSSAERLQSADNSETTTMIESFLKRNAVQDSRIIEYYKDAIPVFIETGVNNETYIEVVSGLQEGDVVILPPILKTANSNSSDNSDSANFMNGFGGMGGGSVAVPEDRGTRSDFQMPSNFNQNSAAPSARQN